MWSMITAAQNKKQIRGNIYLVFVLSFGNELTSDLDLRLQK